MPVVGVMIEAAAVYLVTFLANACVGIVGRVLVALGIGTVTATGFNALVSGVVLGVQSQLSGSGQVYNLMTDLGIIWLISTLLSAVTTKMLVQGLTSDSATFWVKRKQLPSS